MDKALTMTGPEISETIAEAAKAGFQRMGSARGWPSIAARILATAAGVYCVSKFASAALVQAPGQLSPVWPAAGVALAAMVLWGRWVWVGVLAALLVGCHEASLPWLFALPASAGLTGSIYAASRLLAGSGFDPRLQDTRDVVRLILVGAVAPSAVSGLWIALWLVVSGMLPAYGFWGTAGIYLAANACGTLVVAPLVLVAATRQKKLACLDWGRLGKQVILIAATLGAAWLAFADVIPATPGSGALAYLPLPLMVWVALAYGLPAALVCNLGVVAVAVLSTAAGHGPFAHGSPLANFGQIELMVSIFTGTSLLLGAGSESRTREEALRLRAIARESEIERIKAQIHPHFLFNCLGAIHSLVATNPEAARDGVMRLARLLRNSLDTSEEALIPLEREFEIVRDFLRLQQMRFEEGLQVECRIFPNAASFPVPPMLLQPLVENAVKHGREGGDTRVVVMAIANDNGLTVKVENSVDPENFVPPDQWKEGVGLRAARTRLGQAWPGRASLHFHSDTPGWVTATLKVLP